MGTVYKKRITRPLPANATVEVRRRRATAKELRRNPTQATVAESIATWRDRTGEKRTAVVVVADGSQRIRVESATYYCQFRDADGLHQERPTGCRDKQAAQAMLKDFQTTADKIRAKIFSAAELQTAGQSQRPIAEHLHFYKQSLQASGVTLRHTSETSRLVEILIADCEFSNLRDVNAEAVERWSVGKAKRQGEKPGMSPRTRNSYLQALNGFCNWAVESGRLSVNPLRRIKRADESTDRRRQRRALNEPELLRLLYVATWRPLAEFGRDTKRKRADELPKDSKGRKTWRLEPLRFEGLPMAIKRARLTLADNPAFAAELVRRGRERALIYKLAVLTGLRRGEIESLTLGHLELDGGTPIVRMQARETKNREAAEIPLRADLADDLRGWIEFLRQPVGGDVLSMQSANELPSTQRLFSVPRQLVKAFDRDLTVAGILKRDDRGRTVDFHSLRHSFGTLLSKGGVSPRTAQQAMRHSKIDLTMNVYTDPRMLDVAGAMDSLPSLPLDGLPPTWQHQVATGTDDRKSFVAKTVANAPVNSATKLASCDKSAVWSDPPRNEKTPRKQIVSRSFASEADGARTRNHRIDSPAADASKPLENESQTGVGGDGCQNGCKCEPDLVQLADELQSRLCVGGLAKLVAILGQPTGIADD